MKATYRFDMDMRLCKKFLDTFNQDNDQTIEAECEDNQLIIEIRDLKISSLYNMTDDIIRNLSIFEKIYGKNKDITDQNLQH